ncbi:thiol-disulfide isomerase/thioredoxin [Chitinophaga terrae (ex Kim and Jung 2007)]|uniref:TlpA disulfide reductase family protein n=1 Tax=Chitinophaga terrae (ex Kim and Jung 2007) TaxID=408074 RepID=UPI002788BEBE|nr:TlpA disulfide reductase family protein [Chitinophaga terrae (ex Kim and Jung 2007)]MDQ0107144.1 thiol-disulfide isomerase/thioredoxin [Chitinophaga terrae (ex Kim and Jung 2007)]
MKQRLKIIILLLLPFCSFAEEGFVISGKVTGIISGSVSIVPRSGDDLRNLPEKVRIVDGVFTFTGKIDHPQPVQLKISTKTLNIFLENTRYTVDCSFESLSGNQIRGSKANDEFQEFMASGQSNLDYLRAHPSSPLAPWMASMASFKKESILEAYSLLTEEGKKSVEGRELKRQIDIYEKTAAGKPMLDFKMNDPAGKPLSVKDLAGKIVVLDFWASWCAPCIGFIPKLREHYANYSNKGVAFVSVSVDENKEKWKEAMSFHPMEWKQVVAAGGFSDTEGVKPLFNIKGIPYLIIVDRHGNIAASLDGYHKEELGKVLEDLVNK